MRAMAGPRAGPARLLTLLLALSSCRLSPASHLIPKVIPKTVQDTLRKLDTTERHNNVAKLYLELIGDFDQHKDLEPPGTLGPNKSRQDCLKRYHPEGCVKFAKICEFLKDKWIPGWEASDFQYFQGVRGHWFQCIRKVPKARNRHAQLGNATHPHLGRIINRKDIMEDFTLYILSRPEEAVPPQVRTLLLPPRTFHGRWPGSVTWPDRAKFLPEYEHIPRECLPSAGPRPLRADGTVCPPFYKERDMQPWVPRQVDQLPVEIYRPEGEFQLGASVKLGLGLMVGMVPAGLMAVVVLPNLAKVMRRAEAEPVFSQPGQLPAPRGKMRPQMPSMWGEAVSVPAPRLDNVPQGLERDLHLLGKLPGWLDTSSPNYSVESARQPVSTWGRA